MNTPMLWKIRQCFPDEHIADVEAETRIQLECAKVDWIPGASIGITVGSRGVANIALIVKTTVAYLKEKGVQPFIIPAMGSHGGATAEGQRAIVEGYGVTEEYVGAPIRSSLQTVELPQGNSGARVYMDKYAWESDGVIVVGRIKVHTDFHGDIESGLCKMCVIGLGKHRQALEAHTFGAPGLRRFIPEISREIIKSGKIKLGLGLVENAYDKTMIIEAILPENIEAREKELLQINRTNMPSLPTDRLDILFVDKIGKEISGSGMDTNIIGRIKIRGEAEPEFPDINTIAVADMTDATHGNCSGIGLADITTKRLYDKIDFHAFYENTLTSTFVERGKLPVIADSDRQAVEFALRLNKKAGPNPRIARIENTLHLSELWVSQPVLDDLRDRDTIEILSGPVPLLADSGEFSPF